MVTEIETARLVLRQWSEDDAASALSIYGTDAVSSWPTPGIGPFADPEAMRGAIRGWLAHDRNSPDPVGHWALECRADGALIGGLALAYVPTGGENLTIRWELSPGRWRHGYAAEAADALLHWAMHDVGVVEVFALVHPRNARAAATAERVGMDRVRDLGGHLRVYRAKDGLLSSPEPLEWQVEP